MNTPELPDDLRDWPANPFTLLGVAPGAGETDIKRAYTRLIRRFKPEHSPEQFRRVREAYEQCLERFRWFAPPPDLSPREFVRPAAPAAPAADESRPDEERRTDHPDPGPVDEEPVRPAVVVDEVGRLWAAAIEGRDEEVYRGLAELAATRPDRSDLPLRLYWLLGLNPALDPSRTRHDWLADALARSRLGGPAAELYRRELEARPDVGLHGPYLRLLSTDADPQSLLTVARWRLTAAGRSSSWHPLATDFDVLAKVLPFENEPGWLGYLVAATDWLAWGRPQPLYGRSREEVHRLRHLELSHSYLFDRMEETEHVANEWHLVTAKMGAPGLFGLLPHAWAGELGLGVVAPVVAEVAAEAAAHLWRFDQVQAQRREAGGVLALLVRFLENYRRGRSSDDEVEFPAELIRGLARGLPGGWRRRYDDLRPDLLAFLLAESIHPLEFAAAGDDDYDARIRVVAGTLRQDVSLRLVWLACRLHRG